ncbi:hypothetical protein BCR34DRAFT_594788 [Clohesyomyces aquaticus]|uniref:Uncharacterized protein n=1 Tax=Clohesyomyces aquaticus TaxID=1231657 RepID=A0A1Y1Y4P6_9PLEO|nr:hypothetical protein BCR34DRAFT_594788 [Clohesyomyces aquaticus]
MLFIKKEPNVELKKELKKGSLEENSLKKLVKKKAKDSKVTIKTAACYTIGTANASIYKTIGSREALHSIGLLETKGGSRRARVTERGSRNASRAESLKDDFKEAIDDTKVAKGAAKYAPKHDSSEDKDSKDEDSKDEDSEYEASKSKASENEAADEAPKNSETIGYKAASNEADEDLPLSSEPNWERFDIVEFKAARKRKRA